VSNAINFKTDWDSDLSRTFRATVDRSATVRIVQELWKSTGTMKARVNVFNVVKQPEQAAMEFAVCMKQEAQCIETSDDRSIHYVEIGDVTFFFDVE